MGGVVWRSAAKGLECIRALLPVAQRVFEHLHPDPETRAQAAHDCIGRFRGKRGACTTGASLTSKSADAIMSRLGACLGVGMQVLEDALCNWQKSPDTFKPFRG